MPFDDEMFKTFPGSKHPWEMKQQQVKENHVTVATRYNASWSDQEILAVMLAQPPTTYDEVGILLSREPGTIHAVKCFIRKVILHPDQFRKNGVIPPRYGIVRRIDRLVSDYGIQDWPTEDKKVFATLLPGTRETHARQARYLAKNHND